MVKSKGRSEHQLYQEYVCEVGIQLCYLCEVETGYSYQFSVYKGKQGEVISDKMLSYDMVVYLVKGLENHRYKIFTDDFFLSASIQVSKTKWI